MEEDLAARENDHEEVEMEEVDIEVVGDQTVDAAAGDVREVHGIRGTHSMWSGVANFVNSIVGAGIIGLPFAMEEGGAFFSFIVLLATGVLTAYSVRLIIDLGDKMKINDYEILCHSLLGKTGYYVVSISMALFAYGAMLSYLIILGDTLYPVFSTWDIAKYMGGSRELCIVVCGCFVCLPLSSFKDIGVLAKTSAVSILGVFALLIIVVVRSADVAGTFEDLSNNNVGWISVGQPGVWTIRSDCQYGYENITLSRVTKNDAGFQFNFTTMDTLVDSVAPFAIYAGAEVLRNPFPRCENISNANLATKETVVLDVTTVPRGAATLSHPEISVNWETEQGYTRFSVTLGSMPYAQYDESGLAFAHKNFFPAFGVIAFAYVCHHSSFLVRNSLKNKDDWPKVVYISIGIATVLSAVLSIAGYGTFLRCTRPNILNNFSPESDQAINVARILLAFTMIFTFPMEFFVVRQALTTMVLKGDTSNKRHYALTAIIFAATLPPGVLLSSDQLGLVLEFTGGLAASALGFILPGLLWFKFKRRFTHTPPPSVEKTYVEYGSPLSNPPQVTGKPAGMSSSAGEAVDSRPSYTTIITSWEALPPLALLVLGASSLVVNTVLGFMHAAGVDTYENPTFCPDLSDYDFF